MNLYTFLLRVTCPVVLLLSAFVAGCEQRSFPRHDQAPLVKIASQANQWFQDITGKSGLDFVHDDGPADTYFMPSHTSGGAAFLDFDNDGRLDIYLTQHGGAESLARNCLYQQQEDGTFLDVSAGSGTDITGYGQGVAIGDVNNDGLVDIFVTEYNGVHLFLNLGAGKFQDVTRLAGIENRAWGTSAAFLDYDRDGFLDLIVVNYVEFDANRVCSDGGSGKDFCGPQTFVGSTSRLFRNLGARPNGVRFEDVSIKSGLANLPAPGLGVYCADFTGDQWPDIMIANDGRPNWLCVNQRDGTFAEEGQLRGLATNSTGQTEANMGVAVGDVNADGLFDVFVTHLTEERHRLWVQGPEGIFRDGTVTSGLAEEACRSTGFGTILADFDNDGDLDLAIANGAVKRPSGSDSRTGSEFWVPYYQQNLILQNLGYGRFQDKSDCEEDFCRTPGVWRSLASGDINNDGKIDLLVTRIGDSPMLLKNISPHRGHWLTVRALDPQLKRDAYGAVLTVVAGQQKWTRILNPCRSYTSSCDPRVHFGFGEFTVLDRLHILWPDGTDEIFPAPNVDTFIHLSKGSGVIQ
jgi:hypothetical protein